MTVHAAPRKNLGPPTKKLLHSFEILFYGFISFINKWIYPCARYGYLTLPQINEAKFFDLELAIIFSISLQTLQQF